MVLPTPVAAIVDACSVIYNNTLYSYQSDIFQSLPLTNGGQWSELAMGVAVSGGVCVMATPPNNSSASALFIVGGTTNSSNYLGLQKFTFETQQWETVSPSVGVTQNRLYHNAVYLNASDSILVYAGSQDGEKYASSQTFTIQASEPHNVLAYEASAKPAISPMLMQWTESNAVYIGGSTDNQEVMLFSPTTSWVNSNITLADPISNTTAVKSVIVDGDDGSRSLYTFDMTQSPNAVNRTLLLDAAGNAMVNSAPIVSRDLDDVLLEEPSQRMKRANLTEADWPAYNSTLAPVSTRNIYSMAMDASNKVVISGGNTEDVLCIFKARQNCWANATALLSAKSVSNVQGLGFDGSSTSASAIPTATSTLAAAATSPASSDTVSSRLPIKILGAVLGSIAGAAFILLVILMLFRWRKDRKQFQDAGHQRRASGVPDDDKNDMADVVYSEKSAFSPISPTARRFGHGQTESHGSFSSVAMLMGRVPKEHNRGLSKGVSSIRSDTSSQFNNNFKKTIAISNPIPQEPVYSVAVPSVVPPTPVVGLSAVDKEMKGQSFARERSTRKAKRGSTRRSSGWNRYWSGGSALNILGFGSKRSTYEGSDRDSDLSAYSEQRRPSGVTQVSAVPPPLRIPGQPEFNRVNSGSPRIAMAANGFPLGEGMSGHISHSDARSSSSSLPDRYDGFSSGVPESVDDWPIGRAPSEAYTASVYGATLPRGTGSPFPQQERDVPMPRRPQHNTTNSDMSWLNLGNNGGRI
ncbi:hypothetical protein BP5796_10429 [Coleophoma crateriformis]|uniref:Pre-mRNA splicing factor CLF1 n=1 Tax=Coleophoma crateriformis TaxID=565419 RepID=A0A3D8QQ70_9HELO|nr:hypothetical protein BP5796_10429 [Coleophoma crateriformis]